LRVSIATIDNYSTTEEMKFLALVDKARPDARYRAAFVRGVDYLLQAQYPNGCLPQVYPLQGGYHDAATFNDDATVNALRLLRDVSAGVYPFVPDAKRRLGANAVEKGVSCILNAQVTLDGKKTVWGQQHDPLTLAPVMARSYELASLTSLESAHIVDFLMSIPQPTSAVRLAINSAADWFRKTAINGLKYDAYQVTTQPGVGPIWARMYEIGTNRPIFANREGKKLYDWNLLTDRRSGYLWYSDAPAATLETYRTWSARVGQ
jgi:PelA/Pel-15E family pectate lyase